MEGGRPDQRKDSCRSNSAVTISLLACLPQDDFEMILFQLASIGEALTEGSHIFPVSIPPRPRITCSSVAGAFDLYRKRIEGAGWCLFLIQIMSERESMLTYASLQRPSVRKRAIGLMSKTHRCSNGIDTGFCLYVLVPYRLHAKKSCSGRCRLVGCSDYGLYRKHCLQSSLFFCSMMV